MIGQVESDNLKRKGIASADAQNSICLSKHI